jgi:hypothetical protein
LLVLHVRSLALTISLGSAILLMLVRIVLALRSSVGLRDGRARLVSESLIDL